MTESSFLLPSKIREPLTTYVPIISTIIYLAHMRDRRRFSTSQPTTPRVTSDLPNHLPSAPPSPKRSNPIAPVYSQTVCQRCSLQMAYTDPVQIPSNVQTWDITLQDPQAILDKFLHSGNAQN